LSGSAHDGAANIPVIITVIRARMEMLFMGWTENLTSLLLEAKVISLI